MSHFLGTHRNRLDAKGRVSVPAAFRASLRLLAGPGPADGTAANGGPAMTLVLRPSHKHACIEAWPLPMFQALAAPLERLDMFSESHDDMAAALYAEAFPTDADREGRIILPESLVVHANLADTVVFMGLGQIFQIWEPTAAARRLEAARAGARQQTLPGSAPGRAAAPSAPGPAA